MTLGSELLVFAKNFFLASMPTSDYVCIAVMGQLTTDRNFINDNTQIAEERRTPPEVSTHRQAYPNTLLYSSVQRGHMLAC